MTEATITKPIYRVLADLTGEVRPDVALPLALKELLELKIKEVGRERERFETQYGMAFEEFKQAWHSGRLADRHDYEVERDYWEWEAAVTDQARLHEMLAELA